MKRLPPHQRPEHTEALKALQAIFPYTIETGYGQFAVLDSEYTDDSEPLAIVDMLSNGDDTFSGTDTDGEDFTITPDKLSAWLQTQML